MQDKETKPKKKLKPLKQRQKDALLNTGKKIKPKGSNKKVNEDGLTAEEEKFCEIFASDREFFGNGVQSYIEAFDIEVVRQPNRKFPKQKTYDACKASAHLLLTNPHLLKRVNEIFEARGLNDTFVDKQLEKIITQDAEFRPKLGAIQEYNKLKRRTTEQVQHVHAFSDIRGMTDAELAKEEEKLMAFFQKK